MGGVTVGICKGAHSPKADHILFSSIAKDEPLLTEDSLCLSLLMYNFKKDYIPHLEEKLKVLPNSIAYHSAGHVPSNSFSTFSMKNLAVLYLLFHFRLFVQS